MIQSGGRAFQNINVSMFNYCLTANQRLYARKYSLGKITSWEVSMLRNVEVEIIDGATFRSLSPQKLQVHIWYSKKNLWNDVRSHQI